MLEPKTQAIPLKAGIDRSVDPNAAEARGFLGLDNCTYDQDGAVMVRPILTTQTKFDSTAGGLTFLRNGDQLACQSPAPLLASRLAEVFPGQRVMSVEAARENYSNRYVCTVMTSLKEDESHAWYGTFTALTFLSLMDSDGQVMSCQELTATIGAAYDPKIVAVTHSARPSWLLTYCTVSGNDVKGVQVTLVSGALSIGTPFTIQSAGGGTGGKRSAYDVVSSGAIAYVAFNSGTGVNWKSYSGDSLTLATTATAYTTAGAPVDTWVELNNAGTSVYVFYITGSSPTAVIRVASWAIAGGAATGNQVIADTLTLPGVVTYSPSANIVAWNHSLTTLCWATLAISGNATPLTKGSYVDMMIASRALGAQIAVYSANGYTTGYQALDLVTLGSPTTAPLVTGRLAQDDSAPLTLFTASGTADDSLGRFGYYQPRFVAAQSGNDVFFPALVAEANGDAGAIPVDTTGIVRRVRIVRLTTATYPVTATVGRVQLVAGSIPLSWDGVKLSPAAPLSCPAAPTLAAGAAGALSGVYTIRTVVEFVDARGMSWFSPPSPASGAVTLTSQKKTCTATINARLMNAPVGTWKQMRLRFYSTLAGGSTYYYMSSFVMDASAFFGDGDTTVSYDDNQTDGNLATAEQLYSQASDAFELAPPLSHICAHGNRFFGVRSDAPEMVMFTDEAQEGFLPRWNAVRSFRVDNGAGPALACGSLNDSLVVFQAEQLCLVRGDGPTRATSDATTFPVPQRFATVGVHPDRVNTIVSTASGIFFVGRRNAYLIQPDLQVVPVGAPIGGAHTWLTMTTLRARYVPTRNQVWLFYSNTSDFTPSRGVLVLDLNLMRWTTLSSNAGSGWGQCYDVAEVAGTTYVTLGNNAGFQAIYALGDQRDGASPFERRSSSGTTDVPVVQTIDLPWFRPSEVASLRLRKVVLTGRQLSGSGVANYMPTITVNVYVQNERNALASDTPIHTHTWTGGTVALAESFQLAFRSVTQRCHAFRIQIVITPTATSRPIALNTITYMYGVTGPAAKQPAGNLPAAT